MTEDYRETLECQDSPDRKVTQVSPALDSQDYPGLKDTLELQELLGCQESLGDLDRMVSLENQAHLVQRVSQVGVYLVLKVLRALLERQVFMEIKATLVQLVFLDKRDTQDHLELREFKVTLAPLVSMVALDPLDPLEQENLGPLDQ